MKRLTATAGTKSKLAKPVQELIKMIFDVESMKKAMVEFEVKENLGFAADVSYCGCINCSLPDYFSSD